MMGFFKPSWDSTNQYWTEERFQRCTENDFTGGCWTYHVIDNQTGIAFTLLTSLDGLEDGATTGDVYFVWDTYATPDTENSKQTITVTWNTASDEEEATDGSTDADADAGDKWYQKRGW